MGVETKSRSPRQADTLIRKGCFAIGDAIIKLKLRDEECVSMTLAILTTALGSYFLNVQGVLNGAAHRSIAEDLSNFLLEYKPKIDPDEIGRANAGTRTESDNLLNDRLETGGHE